MKRINMFIEYLQNNPSVGVISAISSGLLSVVVNIFTDESILKYIGVFSIWAGALLVVLSIIAKCLEIFKGKKR